MSSLNQGEIKKNILVPDQMRTNLIKRIFVGGISVKDAAYLSDIPPSNVKKIVTKYKATGN